MTLGREDREQDISGMTVTTPPGLLGKVAQIPRCTEPQASAGSCGAESEIGSTTVGAGPGPHPFYLSGNVYLTGPYKERRSDSRSSFLPSRDRSTSVRWS